MFATMNGHSWSSLVTNKESPIEFYFASDARYESVYDMKNNCCIFEWLFKIQMNGVFLFGIFVPFLL